MWLPSLNLELRRSRSSVNVGSLKPVSTAKGVRDDCFKASCPEVLPSWYMGIQKFYPTKIMKTFWTAKTINSIGTSFDGHLMLILKSWTSEKPFDSSQMTSWYLLRITTQWLLIRQLDDLWCGLLERLVDQQIWLRVDHPPLNNAVGDKLTKKYLRIGIWSYIH